MLTKKSRSLCLIYRTLLSEEEVEVDGEVMEEVLVDLEMEAEEVTVEAEEAREDGDFLFIHKNFNYFAKKHLNCVLV